MRTRCGTRIMGYCIPKDDNSSTQKEAPETSFRFTSDKYVNTANGFTQPRRLIVANDTLPVPQIVLYEKQTITIIVHNELWNEAVAIHWHGIDQHHTPFMDVVEFLTQHQIAPGPFLKLHVFSLVLAALSGTTAMSVINKPRDSMGHW